ncbi:hypothetical protein [Rhodanobacter thiooxydans]|uniref:hypothetical protein n=1 Tax=Rhodanobacter thiooxydans TaxID=416169 RepID=UPI001F1635EF|nr:hypothetical protein [Rhodanobacter thiooxydans]UJJ55564.1 hypothetical protein LRK53_03970 [Rhodanobacter thiooxydans]
MQFGQPLLHADRLRSHRAAAEGTHRVERVRLALQQPAHLFRAGGLHEVLVAVEQHLLLALFAAAGDRRRGGQVQHEEAQQAQHSTNISRNGAM